LSGLPGRSLTGAQGVIGEPGLIGGLGKLGKQGQMGSPGVCDNSACFQPPPMDNKGNGKAEGEGAPTDPAEFNDLGGRTL
jgi:hypothetical protein